VSPNDNELSSEGKTRDGSVTDDGRSGPNGAADNSGKGTSVTIQQYHAPQSVILIGDRRQDQRVLTAGRRMMDRASVALLTGAMACVPAAFWASIVWLLWGGLAAAIAMVVVLAVTVLTMGILRSASDWESPAAVSWESELHQAA
jgi:hypothetical protein